MHNVHDARNEKGKRKHEQHLVGALTAAVLLQQFARLRYGAGRGLQFVARALDVRRRRDQGVEGGGAALRRLGQVPGDGEHLVGDAVLLRQQTGATVPRGSGSTVAQLARFAGGGGGVSVGLEQFLLLLFLDLDHGGYVCLAKCLQRSVCFVRYIECMYIKYGATDAYQLVCVYADQASVLVYIYIWFTLKTVVCVCRLLCTARGRPRRSPIRSCARCICAVPTICRDPPR